MLITVVLPAQAYQKRAAAAIRRKFAAGTFSDHMALLRAFQVRISAYYVCVCVFVCVCVCVHACICVFVCIYKFVREQMSFR